MRKITLLTLCLFLTGPVLRAQRRIEQIRFIYGGEEDKPHGTLVVSVGRKVKLIGEIDSLFGNCIVTNRRTFDTLKAFMRQSTYFIPETAGITDTLRGWLRDGYSYYQVTGSDGSILYISEKYWDRFFNELKSKPHANSLAREIAEDF
jgi:hypothetical protein